MTRIPYDIVINYSVEDKCYVANIPQLNYGVALGDTPEQALDELLVSFDGYLKCKSDLNESLPEPINIAQDLLKMIQSRIKEINSEYRFTPVHVNKIKAGKKGNYFNTT